MVFEVTSIASGSKKDADMDISLKKTKSLHASAHEQHKVSPEEAKEVCSFTYPHLNCGKTFFNLQGLKIHAGRCPWKDECEFGRIVNHKGPIIDRKYRVRWKGYNEEDDTCEPRSNIHPECIKDYEVANDVYDYGHCFRCPRCDLPFKSARGVKIHYTKTHSAQITHSLSQALSQKKQSKTEK